MPSPHRIPALGRGKLFIGDGGLETTMIFERGIELPEFASFVLLETNALIVFGHDPENWAGLVHAPESYR